MEKFDPSTLWHSGTRGAADEAVLKKAPKKYDCLAASISIGFRFQPSKSNHGSGQFSTVDMRA
jgi:hypothetical protein